MNKKLTSIALLLAIGVFFFSFPVYAENFGTSTWKTGSNLINNVSVVADIIEARATQMGGSGSSIVWQKDFLVTVQIQNLVDSPVLVNGLRFSLDFPSGTNVGVVSFDSFSSDAWISNDGNLMFTVVPSNDFSYANGIVVPPSESIWVVGTITAQHVSDSNSSFSLSSVNIPSFTTARSDNYPYGATVNWAPLISAIDQYFNTQHVDNNNILTLLGTLKVDTLSLVSDVQDLVDQVTDLISAVSYTGSSPNLSLPSSSFRSSSYSNSGLTIAIQRYSYTGVPVVYDFELNSSSDTPVAVGYNRVPVLIDITTLANDNYSVPQEFLVSDLLSSDYRLELAYSDSAIYKVFGYDSRLILRHEIMSGGSLGIVPKGRNNSVFLFYVYVPLGSSLSLGNFDISGLTIIHSVVTGFYPRNEMDAWSHYFNSYSGNSDVSDQVSSSASSTDSQLSGIHASEEALYSQNQTAMTNSGISNFQFDNSTFSAFNAPRTLFERLWASLGPFTVVYTFSMLLTLALVIIRYTNGRKKVGKHD